MIDLPLPAYLPTDWIPEMALRLQLYRRIGSIQAPDEVAAMRAELEDRFGALPAAVDGLLYQIEVKTLALEADASHILLPRDEVLIKHQSLAIARRELLALSLGQDVTVTRTEVRFPARDDWQSRLLELLRKLPARLRMLGARPATSQVRSPSR